MTIKQLAAASSALSLMISPIAASAAAPNDLVGARAAGGESSLSSRGYSVTSGSTRGARKISYWWSNQRKECIEVVTYDGRFESLKNVGHGKCGKGDNGAAAAAVAVGAAAVIGAIALSGKSHDRNRDGDYQRGYNDGQYGRAFQNYSNSRSYSDGYAAGSQARNPQYGSNNGYNNGYNGNQYGWYDDGWRRLEGRNTSEALDRLNRRGFVEVSNRKMGSEWVKEYWRRGTRECLVIRSAHNRINSIQPVDPNRCRY